MMDKKQQWWNVEEVPKGDVHKFVLDYVEEIENDQADIFDRFVRMAYLYDPNDPFAQGDMPVGRGPDAQITENVIASNVDAAHASIAVTEIRARHHTDDGDWSMQRRAKHLTWYGEALGKMLDFDEHGPDAFKDCEVKGSGFVKICCENGEIKARRVPVNNIVVPNSECRAGRAPRQLHERVIVARHELIERFPKFKEEIEAAGSDRIGAKAQYWAGYRPIPEGDIVYVESWYLGKRHTLCIDGTDILDEAYPEDYFPHAHIRWSKRPEGFYGIGLAERIAGHQRVINKLNWQEDKLIDRHAFPTTYVQMADANLAVKSTSRLGTIAVYKSAPPVTVIPQAVPNEIKERRHYAKEGAYEETGLSKMAATSTKPAGLDSGAALREHKDQTSGRFSQQEKAYERFRLRLIWLGLQCAKKLGDKAPVIIRRSKLGPKKFKWSDVDMGEVKVQMSASSTLNRHSSGRTQLFLEAAQAGVITQEEARQMMDPHSPLDLEHEISAFTASLKATEEMIESVLDGDVVVPEPHHNLEMVKWRAQMAMNRAETNGAPEKILEGLRTLMVQASYELDLIANPPMAEGMPPGPEAMPGAEMGPSPGPAPQAALAPEAMNLIAG